MSNSSSRSRQIFFDTTIHIKAVKDCISGSNETSVLGAIESLGYTLGVDFVRQHPIAASIVVDFAFPDIKLAIEVDGKDHNLRVQRKKDLQRDIFLREHNWCPIRIKNEQFESNPSFWKFLIREVVEERKKQALIGELFDKDFQRELEYEE